MPKTLTDKEFKSRVYSVIDSVEILGEYENYYTVILTKCKICGNIWYAVPAVLLQGHGCHCNMSKIKTSSIEFKNKIYELYVNRFSLLEEYKNSRTKIKVKCNRCGREFYISPRSLIKGNTLCLCDKRKSNEEFLQEVEKVNTKVYVLSEYINSSTMIKVKCKFCGEEFYQRPRQILQNMGHRICFKKREIINSHIKEIKELYPEWDIITPVKELRDQNSTIELKCKKCGYIISNSIASVKQYIRKCQICYPNSSNEENSVYDYISDIYKGKINRNKMFTNEETKKELDIYLPELNIGIEYDGIYWHSYDKVGKNYQLNKLKFFEKLGIQVIFIRSDEWLSKREIVKDKINNLVHINIKKVPARKLIIKNVSKDLKNEFLNRYHIQGQDNSEVCFGLYTKKGQIAALITFSKVRSIFKAKNDIDTYELVRYCVRGGYSIQGGFSKLLKYSIKILKSLGCKRIKTFADRRYSNGNVYNKCGFSLERISEPNYVYFKGRNVYSRIKFQKHKLKDLLEVYDDKLSEYDNMRNNGYSKYYDCGNLVYYINI